MRKGELKRQEMLAAAEKLFCSKGYEDTSVQDILDVLHASKGGFYHHFASKEDVLKLLCAQRAERVAGYAESALENISEELRRINTVLYAFMPLRQGEAAFIRMLMPLIERSEGRAIAMIYQDALHDHFVKLLQKEVQRAAENDVVYPMVRGVESIVLHLANRCWMEAAALAVRCSREGQPLDTAALLTSLEKYRRAVEVLLDAPYGSIEIIRVEEWCRIAEELRLL